MTTEDEATPDREGRPGDPSGPAAPVEVVIDETVAAAIAAHAACAVTGVERLEPGLGSLITHLAARARHQLRQGDPEEPAPTEGVTVDLDGSGARVHIDLATTVDAQAATVAHQVQTAVAHALEVDAGLSVTTVSVSVLDIDQQRPAETSSVHEHRP